LRRGRVPLSLLTTAARLIPHVVDEVAFQTRRNLAQHALVDVVPFGKTDERDIRQAAHAIARGRLPRELPARFAVSASRHAFERRLAEPALISRTVLRGLSARGVEHRQPAMDAAA
jgi:hypothetical protein